MRATCFAVLAATLTLSSAALAGGSSTSNVACGWTDAGAGWNAPKGALVSSRGDGPTRAVMDAIGETYTHVMLSLGTGQDLLSWVTHAAIYTPGTNDICEACDNPANEDDLQYGPPGGSQVQMGAIYTYLYEDGSNQLLRFQLADAGASPNAGRDIANYTWWEMGYSWDTSLQNSSQHVVHLNWPNGQHVNYNLYAFRDLAGAELGQTPSTGGTTCSGFLSYLQAYEMGPSFQISTYDYGHTTSASAVNAFKAKVEYDCNSEGGFWGDLAVDVFCFFCDNDTNVCDDAGTQLGYCMMDNQCHRGHDDWSVPSTLSANTISPDRLGGWNGHPWQDAGVPNSGTSVWAYDYGESVQWNSGGNQYSCWF